MSSVSIFGAGTMARILGTLAVQGGNDVEVISRDPAKAAGLARALGRGATAGTFGAAPAGDIVILAVPWAAAAPVVSQYGDALAGKVIVDITNPFNPTSTGLAIPADTSTALQQRAARHRTACRPGSRRAVRGGAHRSPEGDSPAPRSAPWRHSHR